MRDNLIMFSFSTRKVKNFSDALIGKIPKERVAFKFKIGKQKYKAVELTYVITDKNSSDLIRQLIAEK